jgi:4-hydroxy-2-oxoheptanedioate aldolase
MLDSSHPLRRRLARGPIAGVWAGIPHPQVAGAIAAAGFDFVVLDCEHGGWDFASLEGGIAACETAGASAIVRAPGPDAFFVQRALDLGADGIVVPQVPDAEAARRAVAMAHFPPDGTRGYNPYTRGGHYGLPPQPRLARGYPFTGVLVETPAAAAHLPAIVRIPQLDLVYLGVFDYSVALGIPGQVDDPRIVAFVEEATAIARHAGKAVGTTATNAQQVERLTRCGVNVLLYGVDSWMITQAASAGLRLYGRSN